MFNIGLIYHDQLGLFGGNYGQTVIALTSGLNGRVSGDRNRHGNSIIGQHTDFFQDGHGLLAVNDILDGGNLSILTGDKIAGDIGVGSVSSGNDGSSALIESKDEDITFFSDCGSRGVGFSQVLVFIEIPDGWVLGE